MNLRACLGLMLFLLTAKAWGQDFSTSWQYAQGAGYHLAVGDAPRVIKLAEGGLLHVQPVADSAGTFRYRLRVFKTDTVGRIFWKKDFFYGNSDSVAFYRVAEVVENDSGHVGILYTTDRSFLGMASLGLMTVDQADGRVLSNHGYGRAGGTYEQPLMKKYGRYDFVVCFGSYVALTTVVMRLSSRGAVLKSTQFYGQEPTRTFNLSGAKGLEVVGPRIYVVGLSNHSQFGLAPCLVMLNNTLTPVRATIVANSVGTSYVPMPYGLHRIEANKLLLVADSTEPGGSLLTAGSFVVMDTVFGLTSAKGYKDTTLTPADPGYRVQSGDVAPVAGGFVLQNSRVYAFNTDGTPRPAFDPHSGGLGRAYVSSLPLPALSAGNTLLPEPEAELLEPIGHTVRYRQYAELLSSAPGTACGANKGGIKKINHQYRNNSFPILLRAYKDSAYRMPPVQEEIPALCRLPFCFTMGDYVADSNTCADTMRYRVPRMFEGQITRWSNGDTGLTARLAVPGRYQVYMGTECFTFVDSFTVAKTFPPVSLAVDSLWACFGDTMQAEVQLTVPGTIAWTLASTPNELLSTTQRVRFAKRPLGRDRYLDELRLRVDQRGCVSHDSAGVEVIPRLPHLLADTLGSCQDSLLLNASNLLGFEVPVFGTEWYRPDGSRTLDPITARQTGLYTVTFPYLACPQRDSVNVKFEVLPGEIAVQLPSQSVLTPGQSVEPDTLKYPPPVPVSFSLPAGAANIEWRAAPDQPYQFGQPTLAYAITGDSTLALCARYTVDGCHYQACTQLAVHSTGAAFPTVVTANGDGINDYFRTYPDFLPGSVLIYDLWGKKALEQGAYDGRWPTVETVPGTYFVRYTGSNGVVYKGWVEVVR